MVPPRYTGCSTSNDYYIISGMQSGAVNLAGETGQQDKGNGETHTDDALAAIQQKLARG